MVEFVTCFHIISYRCMPEALWLSIFWHCDKSFHFRFRELLVKRAACIFGCVHSQKSTHIFWGIGDRNRTRNQWRSLVGSKRDGNSLAGDRIPATWFCVLWQGKARVNVVARVKVLNVTVLFRNEKKYYHNRIYVLCPCMVCGGWVSFS